MTSARDYPTEEELQRIRDWSPPDWELLMEFVKTIWWMADWGYDNANGKYEVSTGGWSGNEEIIGAMVENHLFWSLCWESSRRGGHFTFDLTRGRGMK